MATIIAGGKARAVDLMRRKETGLVQFNWGSPSRKQTDIHRWMDAGDYYQVVYQPASGLGYARPAESLAPLLVAGVGARGLWAAPRLCRIRRRGDPGASVTSHLPCVVVKGQRLGKQGTLPMLL